jgi:predicted nucleic acid-binding protein
VKLVIDANIFRDAVLGNKGVVIQQIIHANTVFMSERGVEEAIGVIRGQAGKDAVRITVDLIKLFLVIPHEHYQPALDIAQRRLRGRSKSSNGNVNDAHVLACALALTADIWSHDRDFAGTGVASWSTRNLLQTSTEPAAAMPTGG